MARYYGTIQGARGPASRLGHQDLLVTAQSYNGDVVVEFSRGEGEADNVTIRVRSHGHGSKGFTLYHGDMAELLDMDARHAKLKALGIDEFLKRHEEGAE